MRTKIIFLLTLIIASSLSADAQRSRRRNARKAPAHNTIKANIPQESTTVQESKNIIPEISSAITYSLNDVKFTMVPVKGGSYAMGATPEQQKSLTDEQPAHKVVINDFLIGQTEVTQALWGVVMGDSKESYFNGYDLPVEQVSWNDCQLFIQKMNQAFEGKTYGRKFRLPTEAEWEYAARGGNKTKNTIYSGSDNAEDVAWFFSNSNFSTHPVGSKKPNELNLYDMSGNVAEWCQDWYSSTYYDETPSTNPSGPNAGSGRVVRGGAWGRNSASLRISARSSSSPDSRQNFIGIRLVLSE